MDYYKILEISPSASEEVVRMAYKALVKKYHPDTYQGSAEDAQKMMTKINEAFEVLSNADKRAAYDEWLKNNDQTNRRGSVEKEDNSKQSFSNSVSDAVSARQTYHPPKPKKPNIFNKIANGIGSFMGTLFCLIVFYLLIGWITGNLSEWNHKIYNVGQDIYFFFSATNRAGANKNEVYSEDSAEYVIDRFVQALLDGDSYISKKLISPSNEELLLQTDAISETFRLIDTDDFLINMIEEMKNIEYQIKDIGNNKYEVTFCTYDFQVIWERAKNSLDYNSTMKDAERAVNKELNKAKKKLKYDVTFKMAYENDAWIILDYEDKHDFLNALTGNIYKMLKSN